MEAMMKKRKSFSLVAIVMAALMVLVACGTTETAATTEAAAETAAAAESAATTEATETTAACEGVPEGWVNALDGKTGLEPEP